MDDWGMDDPEDDGDAVPAAPEVSDVPPFEADGFEKIDLDALGAKQYCRMDYFREGGVNRHSGTSVFRRKGFEERAAAAESLSKAVSGHVRAVVEV